MTMSRKKILKAKNDPNCAGVIYRIPWGRLVKEDNKELSDLLVSPGYSKMDLNTHKNIQGILKKYPEDKRGITAVQ